MDNVSLMGQSATLTCSYQTSYSGIYLHWYRHQSDQAPQFILLKRAKSWSDDEYIPDRRYGSKTNDTSTELTITALTLADTALYYCRLYKNLNTDISLFFKEEGSGIQSTHSNKSHTCYSTATITTSNLISIPLKPCIAAPTHVSNPSLNPDTFKSRNGLGIIHLNIRSLSKNLDYVKVLVLQTDPDILVLSESWLQESIKDCDVNLAGYSLF
uniref:Ig-like domain-containing protein n=1 Tax=Myripristis murdjan TaxID=586833 RepID=A0A667WM70_9TELE